ncbi:uncharacterized protein DUF3263 [Krasilnikovia cinnamomea]|uniref:Uncharacterized protein DUF3263 n=1 Tax=Krasilnikovia cinnamomea TaxID=349313 RepID=A0A4Q7ZK37_9ACTN|nr:DUF3263 domain-containing protein [Krasilnikovia cinnamomea]RZU50539.1 uncharacterized protein DUF3263 [Krasilnikovia cinnamomea]
MQPPAEIPDVHESSAVEAQRVPAPRAEPATLTESLPAPRGEAAALAEPEAAAVLAEPAARVETVALTEREEQILAFERKWWKHAGAKEQAVRDAFGLSATRYYQLLNGLLDNPAAYEHDPVLIGRLRRLRSARARTRRR